jgi:LytR cell envelope-related transcriptional attenuator
MNSRRLTTGLTLVVLVAVVCVMAVWGYHAATAPLPSTTKDTATASACPSGQKQKVTRYVRRADITVSVYNSGRRKGRAQDTMNELEAAGFRPGEVNNAPQGVAARRAVVYTTNAIDDPAARLLALTLGKKTKVVHTEDDLGPGFDVVIGDRFNHIDSSAPSRVKLATPTVTCE